MNVQRGLLPCLNASSVGRVLFMFQHILWIAYHQAHDVDFLAGGPEHEI